MLSNLENQDLANASSALERRICLPAFKAGCMVALSHLGLKKVSLEKEVNT